MPAPAASAASPVLVAAGKVVIGAVVSFAVNSIASSLFKKNTYSHQALDEYLRIIVRDLENTVEEVVRNQFFESKFDSIKSNILLASETYGRYTAGDLCALDSAKHDIDRAFAELQTQIDKILAHKNNPPTNPPRLIKSYLNVVQLAIKALQALAPVDLLITGAYIDANPAYVWQFKARIEHYLSLASNLFEAFEKNQSKRVVVQDKALYWPDSFSEQYKRFKDVYPCRKWIEDTSTYYVFLVDGNAIKVTNGLMPTNYSDFYVNYNAVNGRAIQVYASAARNNPEEVKIQFVNLFSMQVEETKTELEVSKQCWKNARDKVVYGVNYNDLVCVITQFSDSDIERRSANLTIKFNLLSQEDKNKMLCGSVRFGKEEFVQICLNNGATIIDAVDEEMIPTADSLLHIAVNNQSESLVQLLLNENLPLEFFQRRNNNRKTAQVLASDLGVTHIETLIKTATKAAQDCYERERFAYILSHYPNIRIGLNDFTLLRESEAININQIGANNDTLLHMAIRNNDARLVSQLMHCRRINPFLVNAQNQTADQLAMASALPDCNALKEKMFFAAVTQGDIVQVRALKNGGTNIHYQNQQGENVFHILRNNIKTLTQQVREDITGFLLQHHVDPFIENNAGSLGIYLQDYPDYHLFQPHLISIILRRFEQSNILSDKLIKQIIGLDTSVRPQSYQVIQSYRNAATGNTLLHDIIQSPLSNDDALNMAKKLHLINLRKTQNNQQQDAETFARHHNRANFVTFFSECSTQDIKTLLFQGTIYQDQQKILEALQLGADINAPLPGAFSGDYLIHHFVMGITHEATNKDSVDKTLAFCRFLLDQGANPHLRNSTGKTAIECVEALYNNEKLSKPSAFFSVTGYRENRLRLFSDILKLLKNDQDRTVDLKQFSCCVCS